MFEITTLSTFSYTTSFILFIFISLNTCVDLNQTVLHSINLIDNVSKPQFAWTYISLAFTYLIKVILSTFIIFALLSIFTIILTGSIKIIGGVISTGNSKDAIVDGIKKSVMGYIQKYTMANIHYMFDFIKEPQSLISFLIILPLFMMLMMIAFTMTVYIPSKHYLDSEDTIKKDKILQTYHHYVYFVFSGCIIGIIIYILMKKLI